MSRLWVATLFCILQVVVPSPLRAGQDDSATPVIECVVSGTHSKAIAIHKMAFAYPHGSLCEPLLVAECIVDGDDRSAGTRVKVGFIANHMTGSALSLVADGETFDLGRLELMDFVQGNECENLIRSVGVEIEIREFIRLARQAPVEFVIGSTRLPLTKAQTDALRALADRLVAYDVLYEPGVKPNQALKRTAQTSY